MATTEQHVHANASGDPTKTKSLRGRWQQRFRAIWQEIRGLIRETVANNDAFRLGANAGRPPIGLLPRRYQARAYQQFAVSSDADRQQAWTGWIAAVLAAKLLQETTQREVREGRHYTAPLIGTAYARGIALANQDVRAAGIADPEASPSDVITTSRHQDALAQKRLAIYSDLKRASNYAVTETTRLMADGFGSDWTKRELADESTEWIRTKGHNRTNTIANTRAVDAVNRGVLERAGELGATEFGVSVEIRETEHAVTTAGDRRVCQRCRSLSGQRYSYREILSGDAPNLPQHPRCRCRWRIVGSQAVS